MHSSRSLGLAALVLLLLIADFPLASRGEESGDKVPNALAWVDGMLHVSLRDGREIVEIDPSDWSVKGRQKLDFRPACLITMPESNALLAGGMDGEIVQIVDGRVESILPKLGRGPVQILALDDGSIVVGSCWSRSVEWVDVSAKRIRTSFPIEFSPGKLLRRSRDEILVLDAFGSKISLINLQSGRTRTRRLEGVNLHAASISGDGRELLIGHMSQYREVPLTSTNIDWGLVISSGLSAVRLDEFDGGDETEGKILARRKITLDGSAHGAADPSGMAVSGDGTIVLITLSGSHQLLKNDRTLGSTSGGDPEGLLPLGHNQKLETLEVGQSPAAVILDSEGRLAVTADSMSDTLTVVQVSDLEILKTITLADSETTPTAVQRGEAAFLDGRRAMDRWMTCASCHPRGHTNGLNFDTLGDGGYGASKNSISLLGVSQTFPYSWIGRFSSLKEQVGHSLKSSLRGPAPDESTVDDLSAYLDSLESPPPLRSSSDPEVVRGASVFRNRNCTACHEAETFTSDGVENVGLDDGPAGHRAFNPPSLRGTAWSAPYLHDGRSASLEQLLGVHPPSKEKPMSQVERDELKAYLESL